MKALTNHVLRDHVLIGGIAAIIASPALGAWGSFWFWTATVLVDIDHYLHFLLATRFKAVGVKAMFRFHHELFERRNMPDFMILEVFHTLEFIALFGILAFNYFGLLRPVFWGIVFHMIVDFVHLSRYGILHKRPHSFIEYGWRRRRVLELGRDPDYPVKEAVRAMR